MEDVTASIYASCTDASVDASGNGACVDANGTVETMLVLI